MWIVWEPCAAGARVLRVLGDSPCPAVPETVEGLPVTEIGPYCFADKPVKAGARRSGADTHETLFSPGTARHFTTAAACAASALGPGSRGWAATCSRTAAALRGCACAPRPMPLPA